MAKSPMPFPPGAAPMGPVTKLGKGKPSPMPPKKSGNKKGKRGC